MFCSVAYLRNALLVLPVATLIGFGLATDAAANPDHWKRAWPNTDFSKHSVPYDEIRSGGPPKDGIPSIDDPSFAPVSDADHLTSTEPVIGLSIEGDARAYPLGVITWHEIVNDTVGEVPVAVTYCPLCNAAIVFDRRVNDMVLDFGTTGKLRYSDLVMYDRQTESWWQQFMGEAIVGELTGTRLEMIPARLESWSKFAQRHPEGQVLVPNAPSARPYGRNPYVGYDSASVPMLFRGELPEDVPAMMRVVAIGDEAWTLPLLRDRGRIETETHLLTWEPGQNSALDSQDIAKGKDVGNILVQRKTDSGLQDDVHDITFAFVFHAFRPQGTIHHN
jgi:hypothetical protein